MKKMASFVDLLIAPQNQIYDTYAELRESGDGVHIDTLTGLGFVTRYEDLNRIFRDPKTYSSDVYWKIPFPIYNPKDPLQSRVVSIVEKFLLVLDPPVHTRLRGLASRVLNAQAVANMRPAFESAADEILRGLDNGQEVDFATEVAPKLPAWAMSALMGIPTADRGKFIEWTYDVSSTLDPATQGPERDRAYEGASEFIDYLTELVENRRRDLGDDLISMLIAVEEDGQGFTPDEVVSIALVLHAGGNSTTTCMVNSGLKLLLDNPDQCALLVDEPDRTKPAIEEICRIEPSLRWTPRMVTQADRIGDHDLEPGTFIWLGIAPANRDPRAFEKPDSFDIVRDDHKHLAFAAGPHYCLGAGLARLEAEVFFPRLLKRFPKITQTGEVKYAPQFIERVMTGFPLVLN
jgi:cytochrome P450